MNRREFLAGLAALGAAPGAISSQARAQIAQHGICAPVLKRGYDNLNSGSNLAETTLTQANVGAQGVKLLFTLPMEGDRVGAEAAPLIVPSVPVDDGTTRDLCIVASMNGLVYAFDANDSDIIWVKKLSVPVQGARTMDAYLINDHWSSISTPVVDPDTNILYVIAWTDPNANASTAYYQLHALNLKDGSRVHPPIPIEGTSNGQTWNKMMRKQRSSLLLATVSGRKTVFFAGSTWGETAANATGWIFGYDVASQTLASLTTSKGLGAGIWMAGSSMLWDGSYLYATTGNGGFDGVSSFGEAVVRIAYAAGAPGSFKIVDWWAGWTDSGREGNAVTGLVSRKANAAKLSGTDVVMMAAMDDPAAVNNFSNWWDQDLGSAPPLYIPGLNILIVAGKDGIAYLVNASDMGKTMPADFANPAANYAKLVQPPQWYTYFPGYGTNAAPANPTALDSLWGGKTRHQHSSSVYYNSPVNGPTVFCGGENSPVRAWKIGKNGLTFLAQGADSASPNVGGAGGMTGWWMSVSANGNKPGTGILWALCPYGNANTTVTNGRLIAYNADPTNGVLEILWDSQAQGFQFLFCKFGTPVVSGGKVFIPTYQDETLVLSLA